MFVFFLVFGFGVRSVWCKEWVFGGLFWGRCLDDGGGDRGGCVSD